MENEALANLHELAQGCPEGSHLVEDLPVQNAFEHFGMANDASQALTLDEVTPLGVDESRKEDHQRSDDLVSRRWCWEEG